MNLWQYKDGWYYSQDGLQRWQKREDGTTNVESINEEPTLTQQQFKDDVDVNVILARIAKTNQMPPLNPITGTIGEVDLTELPSYQEALNTIIAADNSFMELPAQMRLRFNNNPQQLMDYLNDPANIEESRTLGLRNPAPASPAPDPVLTELQKLNKNLKPKKQLTLDDQ